LPRLSVPRFVPISGTLQRIPAHERGEVRVLALQSLPREARGCSLRPEAEVRTPLGSAFEVAPASPGFARRSARTSVASALWGEGGVRVWQIAPGGQSAARRAIAAGGGECCLCSRQRRLHRTLDPSPFTRHATRRARVAGTHSTGAREVRHGST